MIANTSNPAQPQIASLPKGGGAIQGQGASWGPVGTRGEASLDLPLPISPGRGFAPALSLSYRSSQGNSPFGVGWAVPTGAISRDTRKGVPAYAAGDRFIGPDGIELVPERDPDGALQARRCEQYNGLALGETYRVVRYFPVVEARFDRIEHWSTASDSAGFWLVEGADGCVHLFGKTIHARCAEPRRYTHVAQWLIQESLNPLGEHIYYDYKIEDQNRPAPRDYRAQRYLARVCYGNLKHRAQLALWTRDSPAAQQWHFELVLDYGERAYALDQVPGYAEQQAWGLRDDPFSSYAYGFEIGTQRLCRQILMFHYFPDEPGMGADPVLTRRLVLEHRSIGLIGRCLTALHNQAYDAQGKASAWPPVELKYSLFKPPLDNTRYQAFDTLAGLDDGQHYQLLDLYNDGLPGILHRSEKSWYYREPQRAPQPAAADAVVYGPWQALPRIPPSGAPRQALVDLNGDGQLEWVVTQPGLNGFFSLEPHRQWSAFTPFTALPQEFFHPHGQLADLMGKGLYDLALIGSHSVRVYAKRDDNGFEPGREVPHTPDDDALPTLSDTPAELIAFCDLLGSGQQHLVRIRHNEVKCWPNLGRGRFGTGFVFAGLPFAHDRFDAANIRLADLDGSGAVDLLYLEPEHVSIYMNQRGCGLAPSPLQLPWPPGLRYDASCQVSLADLQGLGCSSLILSVPLRPQRHWRYDFVRQKPYLLTGMTNNMGATATLTYRSSAQEWLDEKLAWQAQGKTAGNGLPFAVQVVKRQRQRDLVSDTLLTRQFCYREPSFDRVERQFIGFGLLLETDGQASGGLLTKRWLHTLAAPRAPFYAGDTEAPQVGPTLLTALGVGATLDTPVATPAQATLHALKRALSGSLVREETYAADDPPQTAVPYAVSQQRYLVRQVRPAGQPGEAAVLLPLLLESITCRYERQADDPLCQHRINLRWDAYAGLEHSVALDYPRRKAATAPAPPGPPHEQQWWRDAHDPAQQAWYLHESRADFIHLDTPQRWRLHVPYRQRGNVRVMAKAALSVADIGYEYFVGDGPANPLRAQAPRQLGGLSVHHYCQAHCTSPLPAGTASFQALLAHVEVAELDQQALLAYQNPPATAPSFDIDRALAAYHYRRMPAHLPAAPGQDAAMGLWSVERGFTRYGQADAFYRPRLFQASLSHGVTQSEYDAYYLHVTKVKTPDGCVSRAEYDYRLGLPVAVSDAQGTQQYAHYDAHGYVLASGIHGEEHGQPVGADIRQTYTRAPDTGPAQALADPRKALLNAQTACFYDVFSWMGRVPPAQVQAQWVQKAYVLPSGHIRASALARLNALASAQPHHLELKALIQAAKREPVHAAVLRADRFQGAPGAHEQPIQVALAYSDGSGRIRQTQEKAQPGPAYRIDHTGALSLGAGQNAVEVDSQERWRVSGRTEYDDKGRIARAWRPYFAERAGFIQDDALRALSPGEQSVYDPLGRTLRVLNADAGMRRQTYWSWYTVSEDENDTEEP